MFWLGLVAASPLWRESFDAQPDPGSRDLENRDYFVVEAADPKHMAAQHGWVVEEPFPIEDHWLLSSAKASHNLHKRAEEAFSYGARNVYISELSKLQRRAPIPRSPELAAIQEEFDIRDPLFKDQWFIYNPQEKGHDMNVIPVWRRNITGKGVTVAIVDDGVDYDHPDFEHNFSLEGSWDFNLHQQHPKPLLDVDTHGTRCAGEVAAGKNSVCGVGIAPGANVSGIRILSGKLTTGDEARALIHRYNVNDIYSCSWGPSDDGMTIDGPPLLVRRAELDGIENGRHGKGSIYVVASGNGDLRGDNCNYDGYTNSIYSITVGAVDRQNRHPYYAESCSANMIATYSSNYFDKITTSDRLDPLNPGEAKCTNSHTGTSAAAPIAAGVFALVLEQRPELTWRDLQYLVRDTAKKFDIIPNVPPTPPNRVKNEWITTADGHHYHNSFGYGILDADAIVTRAETWELVKPQTWYFLPEVKARSPITPTTTLKLEMSAAEWEEANMDHIEHVRVRVSYEHEVRGSLSFQLESPAGIISDLAAPRANDFSSAPTQDWEFLSVVHWNETGAGTWKLRVRGPEDLHGIVSSWQLKLFGQAKDVSRVKKFSEVWDDYEGPASVVSDPYDESETAFTESSASTGSSSSSSASSATEAAADAPVTTAASSTSSAVSTTTEATSTSVASPLESSTASPSQYAPHSVLYYVVVSIIGCGVLAIVLIPTVYFGFWRRPPASAYAQLGEDDFELDNVDGSFELDEEYSDNASETERPAAGSR